MSTRPFVPRADGQGKIGISGKAWGEGNFKTINADSASLTDITGTSAALTGKLKSASAEISGDMKSGSATIANALTAGSITTSGEAKAKKATIAESISAKTISVNGDISGGTATIKNGLTAASASFTGQTSTGSLIVTGNTKVITKSAGDNSTSIASTAYADAAAKTAAAAAAALNNIVWKNAAAHNANPRMKDITDFWKSGEMSKAIAAGTFDNIFPWDYIIVPSLTIDGTTYTNTKFFVGDCNYHFNRGSTNYNVNHVLMFPEHALGTARMNASDTTANGYQGSEMWTTTIPKYVTSFVAAFGSGHVLEHSELLTNAMNASAASAAGAGWSGSAYWDWSKTPSPWQNVKVNIFNQAMMYGHAPFASSAQDTGECNKQIAAFRFGQNFDRDNNCWLRDVASGDGFANADSGGSASSGSASDVWGVRPYFLFY